MTTNYQTTPQGMDELHALIRRGFKVFAPPPMPSPLPTPPDSQIGRLWGLLTSLRRRRWVVSGRR
jgi:hypothetical protein